MTSTNAPASAFVPVVLGDTVICNTRWKPSVPTLPIVTVWDTEAPGAMFEALTNACPSWLLVISSVPLGVVVVVGGVVVVEVVDEPTTVVVVGRGAVVVPVGGALGRLVVVVDDVVVVVVVVLGTVLLVVEVRGADVVVVPRCFLVAVVVVVFAGLVVAEGERGGTAILVVEAPGTPPAAPTGTCDVVVEVPGTPGAVVETAEGPLEVVLCPEDKLPEPSVLVVVVLGPPAADVVVVVVVVVVLDPDPEGRVPPDPVVAPDEPFPAPLLVGGGALPLWKANACTALPPLPPVFA